MESWETFKLYATNMIRDSFVETKPLPLVHPDLTKTTHACAASVQISSGAKAEEINNISRRTVAPIEIQKPGPMIPWLSSNQRVVNNNIVTLSSEMQRITL